MSTIGQPLMGEIELVSVSKEELSSLSARIAPVEAFQSASIQFNPALLGARLTVERRPDGRPYLKLSSQRSVEEPYIDLLVELTWSTGRLVREYTALIDPPGTTPAPQAAASAPMVAAPAAPSAPSAATAAPAPAARPQAPAADPGQKTYGPVQSGDTLRKIAAGVRPQGVNLDQVLVGIFRSNPDAFINNNMNLLRTGKILKIPEAAELGQVSTTDAGSEVRTQSADWNAYRQRVAGAAPAAGPGESRVAAGKITARVEEPGAAKDAPKEVLKISKGEPSKEMPVDKALQDRVRVLEEEVTAREKSLKDAGERIASLEKTIKDMQRLLELKGVPPTADKVDASKAPMDSAKKDTAAESKPTPADTKPVAPPPPVAAVKPAPKPIAPEPAPRAEWWEDPAILGGGLLGLGALAGAGYLLARRRREPAGVVADEPVIRRVPTMAGPAAAAGAAAAAVGTSTQPLPAPVPTPPVPSDDVDPIAEADVYIAYGRDAQAEEILKEALNKAPGRQEVKLKLLEIYAARKSKADFNALASELHTATAGQGDVWMRAAAMGFALDPDNALYAAGKDSANLAPIGVQTDVNLDFDLDMVSAAGAPSTVTDLPLESGQEGHEVRTTILSPETMSQLRAEGAAQADATQTDIDATLPATAAFARPNTDVNLDVPPVTGSTSNVIDFEFDPTQTANLELPSTATFDPNKTMVISPENQEKAQNLDIEIDLSSLEAKAPAETTKEAPAAAPADISFDFNVPAVEAPPTVAGAVPPTDLKLDVPDFKPADTATMDFALDTVSFDLGSGQTRESPAAPAHDEHWYDVQTKFDLAKAYQEMGDKEGAREILAEVIKEGDAQQQSEAKALLEKIE